MDGNLRLPCPPPGHLPDPGIEPRSPTLQADSLPAELPEKPQYAHNLVQLGGRDYDICFCNLLGKELSFIAVFFLLWCLGSVKGCPIGVPYSVLILI